MSGLCSCRALASQPSTSSFTTTTSSRVRRSRLARRRLACVLERLLIPTPISDPQRSSLLSAPSLGPLFCAQPMRSSSSPTGSATCIPRLPGLCPCAPRPISRIGGARGRGSSSRAGSAERSCWTSPRCGWSRPGAGKCSTSEVLACALE